MYRAWRTTDRGGGVGAIRVKKRVNAERALDPRTAKGKGYDSSRPLHRARCCRNEAIAIGVP